MALLIKRLTENAILPSRGSAGAAGYDLCASTGVSIGPGRRGVISTGITVQLPAGTYGRIAPRSGLAVKYGINVGAGVIDRDYTGEILVVLFNHGRYPFDIKAGYKVAQLVVEQCLTPEVKEVTDMEETRRGDSGFGSTGLTAESDPESAPESAPESPPEPAPVKPRPASAKKTRSSTKKSE